MTHQANRSRDRIRETTDGVSYKAAARALLARAAYLVLRIFADPPTAAGHSFTRHTMYEKIIETCGTLSGEIKALAISHSEPLIDLLAPNARVTAANYPEFDLLDLAFRDEDFDLVVSDQVLEHVAGDPGRALSEMCRVAKPGALIVATTCFINPIHGEPEDYWRFTQDGLRVLAGTVPNTRIAATGQWGNLIIWPLLLAGLRRCKVRNSRFNPLTRLAEYDQTRWPIVTWVVLRKATATEDVV